MSSSPPPCTRVCQIDPATGWCLGWARTLAEITPWPAFTETERARVWAALPGRQRLLAQRAGGSARQEPTCLGLCDHDLEAGVCRSCGHSLG